MKNAQQMRKLQKIAQLFCKDQEIEFSGDYIIINGFKKHYVDFCLNNLSKTIMKNVHPSALDNMITHTHHNIYLMWMMTPYCHKSYVGYLISFVNSGLEKGIFLTKNGRKNVSKIGSKKVIAGALSEDAFVITEFIVGPLSGLSLNGGTYRSILGADQRFHSEYNPESVGTSLETALSAMKGTSYRIISKITQPRFLREFRLGDTFEANFHHKKMTINEFVLEDGKILLEDRYSGVKYPLKSLR